MTEEHSDSADMTEEAADLEEEEARTPRTKLRYRTLRFVVLFALLVLAMLTGYRYAMNTEANMWYLFQVARSTAWTLDVIGQKGRLSLIGARARITSVPSSPCGVGTRRRRARRLELPARRR